jgi:1,4-alpha-glucan branching enzyme
MLIDIGGQVMYENFGAVINGNKVEFRLFFPDSDSDPVQYQRGGLPNIETIQVTGDFQAKLGAKDWDFRNAPEMEKTSHPKGMLYTYEIPHLPDGYYEYKYFVTFKNGTSRWCTDPCTKYGSGEMENSAFVIGGHDTDVRPIKNRQPQKDLIIYELMPDDFTAEFRGNNAPFDAVKMKLDYLQDLGINAVEFMPWTAWPGEGFNWGYEVFQFFSVEYRYINDNRDPLDKLYRLKTLINELHDRNIHVIMDGVFNHAKAGREPGRGFAYYWLYENPSDSPFIGGFAGGGFFQDLDFNNKCTLEFIADVCRYWIEQYQIDGIRFDYTIGFFAEGLDIGITSLCKEVSDFLEARRRKNVSLMLEHLTDNRYDAIDDTNHTAATGCWFDRMLFEFWDYLAWWNLDTRIMRILNTSKDFAPGKGPVTYIENHDHASLMHKAGGRDVYWKTQPHVVSLLTCPGTPLIHNGQEFGEDYDMPEGGSGRVMPRPLHWGYSNDYKGKSLLSLYKKLIAIRKAHPALRSSNFYPESYSPNFNEHGYGVDVDKDIVIYHRWGSLGDNKVEKFIIVLNFSGHGQYVDIPFSNNGAWKDLLNDRSDIVVDYRLFNQLIESNWGRIYYMKV